MSMFARLAAVAACVALPAGLSAQPVSATGPGPAVVPSKPPASDAAIQARLPKARALVLLINPTEALIDANMRGWEASMKAGMAQNPAVVSLEERYPGIGESVLLAMRPHGLEHSTRFVAKALDIKSAIFAARLSEAEMDEAIAFFSSPAGGRLIGRILANLDQDKIARDSVSQAVATGKPPTLSPEVAARTEREATRAALGQTSADDHVLILKFQQRPVAGKVTAAAAESDRQILHVANNPDPEWLKKQGELFNAALLAFVESRNKI